MKLHAFLAWLVELTTLFASVNTEKGLLYLYEAKAKKRITAFSFSPIIPVVFRSFVSAFIRFLLFRYLTASFLSSADVLQKIAKFLNTTTDFLMNGGNENQLTDKVLLEQFKEVEQLNNDDKHLIKTFIDAFLTKRKVQKLAQ